MVRIRLKRIGQRNRPFYRIVVTEGTRSRDGKYIEALGHYNPRDKALVLNRDRADFWLTRGAQPSDTAKRLLHRHAKLNAPPAATVEAAPPPTAAAAAPAESEGGSDEATG
jgi:small subunit ribosomal protein S16